MRKPIRRDESASLSLQLCASAEQASYSGTCWEWAQEEFDNARIWEDEDHKLEHKWLQNNLVQYRPLCQLLAYFETPIDEITESYDPFYDCTSFLLFCDQSFDEETFILTLKNIAVRPTHYSFRYSERCGMSDWNFEGSVDGISWDTLHQARGDSSITRPSESKIARMKSALKDKCVGVSGANSRGRIAAYVEHFGLLLLQILSLCWRRWSRRYYRSWWHARSWIRALRQGRGDRIEIKALFSVETVPCK